MGLPNTPNGVCVTSTINALSLRINWGTVNGVSSYSLYRSPIPHDSFSLVSSGIPGLTYYDDPQSSVLSLNLANLWYYRVSAVNVSGEGSKSSPSTYFPYGVEIQSNVPVLGLSYSNLIGG